MFNIEKYNIYGCLLSFVNYEINQLIMLISLIHFLSSLASLTTGLKPFSPRSPGDINLEDVVKFSRAGGKLSQGTVKFVGHLPGRSDAYLGVELDREGKHDTLEVQSKPAL